MTFKINTRGLILISIIFSCKADQKYTYEYKRHVGDIEHRSLTDGGFLPCGKEDDILQYFNFGNGLQFEGEKTRLKSFFFENYVPVKSNDSGMIRIRFIVNCKGETGRFRLLSSDLKYQPKLFNEQITSQILELTKSLNGWAVMGENNISKDYYQYLIFKIKDGNIIEIYP